MNIAVIPIDNRPICYDLIQDVFSIDKNINLFMPENEKLGGLTTSAKIDEIFNFIQNLENTDYLIVSLDTLTYGGLVTSRRTDDDFETIKKRVEKFKELTKNKVKKILAFSSIMRISNNNINEEEKEYWSLYGKKIFDYSFNSHKFGHSVENDIPAEILDDYLKTRKRNFEINKLYLELAKENFFDTLIFSKDDCAEFGFNVQEANYFEEQIEKNNLNNVLVKTGADEIPLSLISRAINHEKIRINACFTEKNSINLISKYEDISIKSCVEGQLNIANCKIDNENYDLTLIINNFKKEQGDLVLGDVINSIDKKIDFKNEGYFIADVNNSNGADKKLIELLFKEKYDKNFFGYCGYNTSANTLGCAIFCAIVKYYALKNNSFNEEAFKKFQFIRFMDDYSYQAISRKFIREKAPEFLKALKEKEFELNENSKKISKFLNFFPKVVMYSLPWDRSFEIRIKVEL